MGSGALQSVGPKHPRVGGWKAKEPVSLADFARSWLYQPHMPNVTLTRSLDGITRLAQACAAPNCTSRWFIPIRHYRSVLDCPLSMELVGMW